MALGDYSSDGVCDDAQRFANEFDFQLAGDEYAYKYSYLTGSSGQIGLMILFFFLLYTPMLSLTKTKLEKKKSV